MVLTLEQPNGSNLDILKGINLIECIGIKSNKLDNDSNKYKVLAYNRVRVPDYCLFWNKVTNLNNFRLVTSSKVRVLAKFKNQPLMNNDV